MLKVLFIDDDRDSVTSTMEAVEEDIGKGNCRIDVTDFSGSDTVLNDFMPDIVVLDIFRGGAHPDGDTAGVGVHETIWNRCFCPIVVYSALPDAVEDKIKNHPFVKCVQKGSGSESRVISYIKAFQPHVEALGGVQTDIRECMNREIRDIAPLVFGAIEDATDRKDVLVRSARRRIAAMMDYPSGGNIKCWEQYLYPPVGSDLLTGDVIRKRNGDRDDPEQYYLVLTPSCDLVCEGDRTPNVKNVLVAKCSHIENVLPEVQLNRSTRQNRFKDRIMPLLTRGYGTFSLPLPQLPDILPPMMAHLKMLELVALNKIGNEAHCEYCRIVSVDSPFRELITWAYLQIAGRPGLPERDFDNWANQIYSSVSEESEGGTE